MMSGSSSAGSDNTRTPDPGGSKRRLLVDRVAG